MEGWVHPWLESGHHIQVGFTAGDVCSPGPQVGGRLVWDVGVRGLNLVR